MHDGPRATTHHRESAVVTLRAIQPSPPSTAARDRAAAAGWLATAALLLVVWSIPAGLNVAMDLLARPPEPGALWPRAIASALPWYVWAPFTPVVWRLVRERPLLRPLAPASVVAHLALGTLVTAAFVGVLEVARAVLGLPPRGPAPLLAVIGWSPFTLLAYAAVAGLAHGALYARRARDDAIARAVLAEQLARAQLDALRMQLHPHFLFNALNTIAMLVRDRDADTAVKLIAELGGILRELLRDSDRSVASLGKELEIVGRYLAIEQVRFGNRLAIQWDVDPLLVDAAVPPFILQPIVENAVRHGVARGTGAGWIRIAAAERDGTLVLTVADNGPDGPSASQLRPSGSRGLGIANTTARLRQLYGDEAYFRLTRSDGNVTLATIAFPLGFAGRTAELPAPRAESAAAAPELALRRAAGTTPSHTV